ncbi:exportin-6-A-like [Saccostrea cucullata]|uniref:exportin-6-A-like n=1 Tax=Saccostrea cuccullata TaxID=36930 RepID=UPI002ED50626
MAKAREDVLMDDKYVKMFNRVLKELMDVMAVNIVLDIFTQELNKEVGGEAIKPSIYQILLLLLQNVKRKCKEGLKKHDELWRFIRNKMKVAFDHTEKKLAIVPNTYKHMEKRNQAAPIVIQRAWKKHVDKRNQAATIVIQRAWKKHIDKRKQAATIVIQRAWKKHIDKRNQAATIVIQRAWKKHIDKRKQAATIVIQRAWKMHIRKRNQAAAIVIQFAWKKHMDKRNQAAAIVIQQAWKKHMDKRNQAAAIVIQRAWKKHMEKRNQAAAIVIQRAWKKHMEKRNQAATILSHWRKGFKTGQQKKAVRKAMVRKLETDHRFQIFKKVSEFCQQIYETKLHGGSIHEQCLILNKAALIMETCLTSFQNRWLILREEESARRIQAWYKGKKRAAVTIQAFYKGFKTRSRYQRIKKATLLIQAGSRGLVKRRKYRRMKRATSTIQRAYRNYCHNKLVKYEPFREHLDIYLSLDPFVRNNAQGRHLTKTAENECRKLHCSLQDISSLFQALGRLSEHFIGERFLPERINDGTMLLERSVKTDAYVSKSQLFNVISTIQNVLHTDFVGIHAQAIPSVKAFAYWLSQCYSETQKVNLDGDKIVHVSLISTLLDSIVPKLSKEIPEKMVHSTAHVLLSITTTVKPKFLLHRSSTQTLCKRASQEAYDGRTVEVQVYGTLSHSLILPWPNENDLDQKWASRAADHQAFFRQLARHSLHLKDTRTLTANKGFQEEGKSVIKRTAQTSRNWIKNVAREVVKSEQICYQSLQGVIDVTPAVFSVYLHQPDEADSLMSFFLALFQEFRIQMGVVLAEQTKQTFMTLCTQEQIAESKCHEITASHRVVEKLFKISELIEQEPGSAFKAFLPNVISMCMDPIYPLITQRPLPDIKVSLYRLVHELMMNNWRYFFKGSVMKTISVQYTPQNGNGEIQNGEEFTAIMQEKKEKKFKVDEMKKPKKLGRMRRVAHWFRKTFFSCGGKSSS